MPIITKLRNQSGILVGGLVSIFLLIFIFSSGSMKLLSFIRSESEDSIGSVAGKNISGRDFYAQVEKFKSVYDKKIDPDLLYTIVWQQTIHRQIVEKECNDLGIEISEPESIDIIQGDNIHQIVKSTFVDKETNTFNKNSLLRYLQELPQASQKSRADWNKFEKNIIDYRRQEKFLNLLRSTSYVTNRELQYKHELGSKSVVINCIYIPYNALKASDAIISDNDISQYINKHKDSYQVDDSIKVKYVAFPIDPTDQDLYEFTNSLKKITEDFAKTTDDLEFVKSHTDGDIDKASFKFDITTVPAIFKNLELKPGLIIGPVRHTDSVFKIYKISTTAAEPNKHNYTCITLEKHLLPGDIAKNNAYSKAAKCASSCKTVSELEKYASQELLVLEDCFVGKNTHYLSQKYKARSLIRSLFNNPLKKVSEVFETEGYYLIAIATEKVKKGIAPISMIRDKVTNILENENKAKVIIDNFENSIQDSNLKILSGSLGDNVRFIQSEKLKFSDTSISDIQGSSRVIGTAFGMQVGDKKIVADDTGIFIIEIVTLLRGDNKNIQDFVENFLKSDTDKTLHISISAAEELAKVVDNRHKLF